MQRKRPRGYYSDTVELGANILPMRQIRKFTMNKLLKYFCLIALGFCIYSMYEKIMEASKASENADRLTDTLKENIQLQKDNGENNAEINNGRDQIEKRVKEHINNVFEEFKHKQEIKNEVENRQDVFRDYVENIENNDDDDGVDDTGLDDNDAFNANENDFGEADDDDNFNEDLNDDDFQANANIDDDGVGEEDEEDKEKELEELEIEKEIEERIADVFKDAFHEAEAEDKGEDKDVNNQLVADKLDKNAVNDVKIPNVQQVFEKRQFDIAVDGIGRQLNPLQIKQMNEKAAREALKQDHDHEFPPFVTAARQTTLNQIKQLAASIQILLPGRKIYVYNLDLTEDQKTELASYCNVRVHMFFKELFPKIISQLDNLHWKPLVMQTALAEFGHMIWVNPGFRLATQELAPLIHESHERGVIVLGQSASYTTFAATHPGMLKFIPVDIEKLSIHPHIEIRAIFIHNSQEVHENLMKMFTSCALEESCLAPSGSKWQCKFDLSGRKYAGCHRYDESALNILLKNWFNFETDKFAKRNSYFKKVDPDVVPKLKVCRHTGDKRAADL